MPDPVDQSNNDQRNSSANRRRVRARHRTAWEIMVLALTAVLFIGGPWLFFHQRKASLESASLQQLTFYIFQNADIENLTSVPLVVDGRDETVDPADLTLSPADFYRISGDFDRPTWWYVLWFDTDGSVAVKSVPKVAQTEVMYPEETMAHFSQRASLGVHLLVLVASSVPPKEGVSLLENVMQGLGKPPDPPRQRITVRPQGSDKEHDLPDGILAGDYVRAIKDRMPAGCKPVLMIFVPTRS